MNKNGKTLIWVLAILIILIIGVFAYFWLSQTQTYLFVKDISAIDNTIEIAIVSGKGINGDINKLQDTEIKTTEAIKIKNQKTGILKLNDITYLVIVERLNSTGNDGEKNADIKVHAQEIKNVTDGNIYKIK